MPSSRIESYLRRTEPRRVALTAFFFWALAAIALASLMELHFWGLSYLELVGRRASMVGCLALTVLAAVQYLHSQPKPVWSVSFWRQWIGTPGLLLFIAVASYLAIGATVLRVDGSWQADTAADLRYRLLHFGILVAAAVGGRALLERTGAERLLRGVLIVLIASCAIILASPVLRSFGILPPYRIPFRLTGAFTNPNEAALVACMAAVLAAAFLTNGASRRLGYLGLAAGTAATLATASRMGFLVLVAILTLFALFNLRNRRRAVFLLSWAGGLVGFAIVAVQFTPWALLRVQESLSDGSLCASPLADGSDADTDCALLLAVRDVLAGEVPLNWRSTLPLRDWWGVTVDGRGGRVTHLSLMGHGMNGRIPAELGRLDQLVHLELSRNRLTGPIPPELGKLANLAYLGLSFNRLTGAIPPELAELPNLEQLWLRGNRLTGPIPPALGGPGLSVLRLAGNDFAGPVPRRLYEVPDNDLHQELLCRPSPRISPGLLADCALLLAVRDELAGGAALGWSRHLPIGRWRRVGVGGPENRVIQLTLAETGLAGRVPPQLARLDGLVNLHLSRNRLTGPIPPELGKLANLEYLGLAFNRLTGAIPPELAELRSLRELWLRGNRLTGPIPPALGGPGLSVLRLAGNDFAGPVPRRLYEVPDNDLHQELLCRPSPRISPGLLADCALLLAVRDELAGGAALGWDRHLSIVRWRGVTLGGREGRVIALELPRMGLNGRIPAELGSLVRLRTLVLDGNWLTGAIPPELGNLADLQMLALTANNLTGPVPAELGKLKNLRELWLNDNRLTGPMPPNSGPVGARRPFCPAVSPDNPGLLADCALLLLVRDTLAGDAKLNWSAHLPLAEWQGVTVGGPLERVTKLALTGLNLNGRIPPALGRLSHLVSLHLDQNRLSGFVPPELGKLANLKHLELSFNHLTGPIPPELAELRGLQQLWLRGNRLTGPIPSSLGGPELSVLRLAGNDFAAPVPPRLYEVPSHDLVHDLLCRPSPRISPGLLADCALLLAVRDELAGGAPGGWSRHLPIGRWRGVHVGGPEGRVIQLFLGAEGLAGRIPPQLARLDGLVKLNLSGNRLTGPIPPELGKLANLEFLGLAFNRLTGAIPPELAELRSLQKLFLRGNRLTGPVPPQLGKMDNLTLLRLAGNDLARPFPLELYEIERHDLDVRHAALRVDNARTAYATGAPGDIGGRQAESGQYCRPSSEMASDLLADCALLLANRDILAGEAPLNWDEDIPIAFWQGVSAGGLPPRVTALELPGAGLNGRLAAELGDLGGLVALDLGRNRLAGPIPLALGRLTQLVSLRLERNELVGPVPPELGTIEKLSFLRLAGNDLTGPFPPMLYATRDHDLEAALLCQPGRIGSGLLADCALLLSVQDELAGDAPLNWGPNVPVGDWQGIVMAPSRSRVAGLDLTQLGLNGRIPPELGRLAGLVSLRLSRNRLAGPVPPELGDLTELRTLALDGNALTGRLPPELGKLSRLRDLRLHGNTLTGPLPPSVVALPGLAESRFDLVEVLTAGRSRVVDTSPRCQLLPRTRRLYNDCSTLLRVRDTLAGDVELNWSAALPIDRWRGVTLGFPPSTERVGAQEPRIVALDLSHMGLNGRIPDELSLLDELVVLHLGDNRLEGSIPPELGALAKLRTLKLENNGLTGAIPEEFGALRQLARLLLGGNELVGPIPGQIDTLANLEVLSLEGNSLTGSIPGPIGTAQTDGLPRLAVLRLGGNSLSDCIPLTWREARARYNSMETELLCEPPPWRKPSVLEDGARLMLVRDALAVSAPLNWSYSEPVVSWQGVGINSRGRVEYLDLRGMNLGGRIPPEVGLLDELVLMWLDGNQLGGPMPPELGKLTRLTLLSLGDNNLVGAIPPELGGLRNLEQLWLTNNRLSGPIPPELGAIEGLWSIRVADNDIGNAGTSVTYHLGGLNRRLLLWRLGFEKAMEAPLFGHGLGTLISMEGAPIEHHGRLAGVHNLYLALLGEAGIVPLLLFVSGIFLLLRSQWRAPRSLARDSTAGWVVVFALNGLASHHLLLIAAAMFLLGLSVAMCAASVPGRHDRS